MEVCSSQLSELLYTSDKESLNEENTFMKTSKRRRNIEWIHKQDFESSKEAENLVSKSAWNKRNTHIINDGKSVTYECKMHLNCEAKIRLLYYSHNSLIGYYESEDIHNENEEDRTTGILKETKECIRRLLSEKITEPNQILRILKHRNIPILSKSQLNNFLAYEKRKMGPRNVSLGEFEEWCQSRIDLPLEDDEPFVVDFDAIFDDPETASFHCIISTKRLLRILALRECIHIDSTYKLNFEGIF